MSKTKHLPHRITAILLSVLLLTSMIALPESAISAYADSSFEYQSNSDGTASITGYTGTDTVISIPSIINGRTVKEICKNAFEFKNLTSVTLPDTVETLQYNSFAWCSNLSNVTLPDSLKTINGFTGCTSLTSVILPQNVENLYFAFWGCTGLTDITIPGTVNNLTSSFSKCTNLKTVTIENGVEKIDSNAFANCTNLTSITIPATVTSINDTAFDNDYQFSIYGDSGSYAETFALNNDIPFNSEPTSGRIENGFIYKVNSDGTASITGYAGADTVINVPSTIKGRTVTEIYKNAFEYKDFTSVTVPDTIISLQSNAFSWCSNLSNVVLPNSLKTINAFSGCTSLTSVTLPTDVEDLTMAFWGCSGLTEITIPGTVNNLTNSFNRCTNLETVTIEDGVEKIDSNAFANCTNLTSITIPITVTSINDKAFDNADQFSIRGVSGSYAEQYAKSNNVTFVSITEPTYEWNDDYSLCTATRIINTETYQSETETKETEYTVLVAPTCEKKGEGKFTVTFSNEAFEQQTKTVSIDPIGHDYGEPEWQWSDDYGTATALFVCKNDQSHTQSVDATITIETTEATCETAGKTVYTATVTFEGNPYTDTKEVPISAKGHNYKLTGWEWDGYDSATATFTCENDSKHTQTVNATITSETTEATCETDGKTVYTATATFEGKPYTDTKEVPISAKGHNYELTGWEWDGYDSATATFTCKNDTSDKQTVVDEEITDEVIYASCEENGKIVFTAEVELEGYTYTDTKEEPLYATGHRYELTGWNWNGYTSATAIFTCERDKSHTQTVNATITSKTTAATCEKTGKAVYTATVVFEGQTYTDTKQSTIPAKGHNYKLTYWTWSEYYAATATFTCENNGLHMLKLDADITSTQENDSTITHTAVVVLDGIEYSDSKTEMITLPESDSDNNDKNVYWASFIVENGSTKGYTYGEKGVQQTPGEDIFTSLEKVRNSYKTDEPVSANREDDGTYTVTFEILPNENYKLNSVDDINIQGDYELIRQSKMVGLEANLVVPQNTFTITGVKSDLSISINLSKIDEYSHLGFTYTLLNDNTYRIDGYSGHYPDITIPNTINELPVSCWADKAFSYNKIIQRVTMTDSVNTIGEWAFSGCPSLKSIDISNSVTSIDNYAFNRCEALQSIVIPDSVKSLGTSTFGDCKQLKSVTIGSGITVLPQSVFSKCTSLETVTIPSSIKSINLYAFSECSSLKEVTLTDSLLEIDYRAFEKCSSLESITIPKSVKEIGSYCFAECSSLKRVNILNPKVKLNNYSSAFDKCYDLTIYCYPDSTAEAYAIKNDIPYEYLSEPESDTDTNTKFNIEEYVSNGSDYTYENGDYDNTIKITGYNGTDTKIEIPSKINGKTVTEISSYAFNGSPIESVILPNTVNTLRHSSFNNCNSLKSVYFPHNVSLETASSSITIGNYTNTVSASPFENCPNLTLYCPSNADIVIAYATENNIPYEIIDYSEVYEDDDTDTNDSTTDNEDSNTDSEKETDSTDNKPDIDTDSQTDNKPNVDTDTNTDNDQKPDNPPNVDTDTMPDDKPNPIGMLGDVDSDGEITANDALTILRSSVGMTDLTPEQTKLADVDNDGEITANDALAVLRYSVGMADADSPINKPVAA